MKPPSWLRRTVRAFRASWREARRTSPWEGMYPDLDLVPVKGEGFGGAEWLRHSRAGLENIRRLKKDQGHIPPGCLRQDHLLSFLAAATKVRGKDLKILDFGGGVGGSYEALLDQYGDLGPGSYHVVEGGPLCALGRELFKGDDRIVFHEDFPEDLKTVDIVFISTVMQYVPDYAGALRRLAGYNPRHFLFTEFCASAEESFSTGQINVPGSVLAFRFISLRELENLMTDSGYSLVFRAGLENTHPTPWPGKAPFFWNLLFEKMRILIVSAVAFWSSGAADEFFDIVSELVE